MVRPDSMKVCVVGDEMAGKTTFVNSLLQLGCPPPKEEDRTHGVAIYNCQIPGVGKGSTWDFGAQPTFHSAHGLFFQKTNTIFCLVLPIQEKIYPDTVRRLLKEGLYWCAFSKAAMRTLLTHSKSRISLVVIFNLIAFNENEELEIRFLKEVGQCLQEEFEGTFQISHMFKMDCSKSHSKRMNVCRKVLKKFAKRSLRY